MANARKLLAVASGGGHWTELMRLRPAFADWDVVYVSTSAHNSAQVEGCRFHTVPDASRFRLAPFVEIFCRTSFIMLRERPRAVVTTGSAPMLFFVLIGRLFGIRTLWIDIIAQSDRLSMSGRIARRIADRTVSQWPDVALRERVQFWGQVL